LEFTKWYQEKDETETQLELYKQIIKATKVSKGDHGFSLSAFRVIEDGHISVDSNSNVVLCVEADKKLEDKVKLAIAEYVVDLKSLKKDLL
jgi:hypothetical protein